ncbi:MAG TPA: hypothetical protein VMM77_03245 [Gemmatimonadaceae bacterium]|nr:hypothetical protein [Gemmatimonadaceae bacterium]
MPANFPEPSDHRRSSLSTRALSTGRTGLMFGAVVVIVMLAAFVFFWRGSGARQPDGTRPPPAQVDSLR